MIDQSFLSTRRTVSALFALGFVVMLAGAFMFLARNASQENVVPSSTQFVVERSLIMAAVVVNVIGFMLLEGMLVDAGDRVLARIGATIFLIAAVMVVVAEAIRLGGAEKLYPLIVIYVVLAVLAQAAFGRALLRTGLLPGWIGWTMIIWNIGWLVLLPLFTPGDIYFPVLHHLMPLVIGIALQVQR